MPGVLEPMAFGPPRRQRQPRVDPVERLNRRFLIDAEDHGVLRWVEIEADHVGRLGFEVRIRRAHVALEAMGLQAGVVPRAGDDRVGNTYIAEDNTGRLFQVTPDGEIVWEYVNRGGTNRPAPVPYDFTPQLRAMPRPEELSVTPMNNLEWHIQPDVLREP